MQQRSPPSQRVLVAQIKERIMKTIRLPANEYRLADGVVETFRAIPTGYEPDYNALNFFDELEKTEEWKWVRTKYAVGNRAVLGSSTDVSPNAIRAGAKARFFLSFDLDGIGGNSDPSIKRTSGWRGTTNDVSVNAHGTVTVRKIRTLKNGDVAVTVS
jgi:hypothetical protein